MGVLTLNSVDLDTVVETGKTMIQNGIVIAPWLTWGQGQYRISMDLLDEIRTWAARYAALHWRPDWTIDIARSFPIPVDTAAEACREAVSGTAVYLSHIELGTLRVSEEMVSVATRLTEDFIEKVGLKQFVTFYLYTIIYEDLQALQYYGSMQSDDFLKGQFHRPWGVHTLQSELHLASATGMIEIDSRGVVQLTPYGEEILHYITQVFTESGFLKFRFRLIRLNKFNTLDDIESIMNIVFTNAPALRTRLIEFSEIRPGMTVLELGCGNGALTFGAGLYEVIGPHGRLVATDPSMSMLASVKRKRDQYGADWVEVIHAKAERLPFPDKSFDCVIGSAFLHLTDIAESVREIARVLKPGGTFSTFYPLHFPGQRKFFLEWFEPLLKLESKSSHADALPGPDTVPKAMQPYFDHLEIEEIYGISQYTSPRTIVKMIVDIGGMFEQHTDTLPWRARQDLINELIRRGEEICRKYPPEELTEEHPGQMIRAIVKDK